MCTTHVRSVFVAVLPLIAIILIGCDKEVKLTFINTTSASRDLELTVPGEGIEYLGVLGATGGRVTYKLKIDEDYLPVTCTWEAGNRSDQFTITKESKDKMLIAIDPTGNIGPIDKRTDVRKAEEKEVKELIIEQHEVVE
ncbi:MAG: hypothetical protein ACYSTL_00675 [Planctomycetota bacterium]|jgi:hypothetical protein